MEHPMPRKRYPATAAEIEEAVNSLSLDEQANWTAAVRAWLIDCVILTDEEHDTLLRRKAEATTSDYITFDTGVDPWQRLVDLHLQLEARNRRSDPETIRRNVEICDLRKQDRKLWSLGRLAGKYGVTKRAISFVLEEEDKWRQLAVRFSL
jgi:hypothetical protein